MKKVKNLEDSLYSLSPVKVARYCRRCQVLLPQSNYFHCNDCKKKIEFSEGFPEDVETIDLHTTIEDSDIPEGFGE